VLQRSGAQRHALIGATRHRGNGKSFYQDLTVKDVAEKLVPDEQPLDWKFRAPLRNCRSHGHPTTTPLPAQASPTITNSRRTTPTAHRFPRSACTTGDGSRQNLLAPHRQELLFLSLLWNLGGTLDRWSGEARFLYPGCRICCRGRRSLRRGIRITRGRGEPDTIGPHAFAALGQTGFASAHPPGHARGAAEATQPAETAAHPGVQFRKKMTYSPGPPSGEPVVTSTER
jgi:hypothetical protein